MFEKPENTTPITVELPSGKEVELKDKRLLQYERFQMGSMGANPMPGDYNNWTGLVLENYNDLEPLDKDDRIFIMNKIPELYY